ncbi:MAG: ABC transporter permease [Acidimicrobiales bacterium]
MSIDRIRALVLTDLRIARRDGEQLLLTLGLPLLLLVFFSSVDVLPTGDGDPVDFLTPGVLSLALLSVSFVRVAIGLGFDRSFGAIRRFAVTPLRASEFITAKFVGTVVFFCAQLVVLAIVALVLGWDPSLHPSIVAALALGLIAFSALGIVVASVVEGLTSLALANTLYVLLLILSGLVFELDTLPGWLGALAKLLPSTALAELLRSGFAGSNGAGWAWGTLMVWAAGAPLLALRLFRWE